MPRRPRILAPNAIYHVTSRGNRGQPIFLNSGDHLVHLWWMGQVAAESEWQIASYVHLTNHYHFLVQTPKPNLSQGMQRLNGLYGQVFNIRHGQTGHLFQGRFHSELVESEGHLLESARYDDLNPVRAGLCDHPLEWRWSSCRATMGLIPKPDFLRCDWLLGHFGLEVERARHRYLAFVEDRLQRAA